jgi:hypothetical protein
MQAKSPASVARRQHGALSRSPLWYAVGMKLRRLTIDFAPNARPMDPRLVLLEAYVLPAALAAAALAFIAWLLRD